MINLASFFSIQHYNYQSKFRLYNKPKEYLSMEVNLLFLHHLKTVCLLNKFPRLSLVLCFSTLHIILYYLLFCFSNFIYEQIN